MSLIKVGLYTNMKDAIAQLQGQKVACVAGDSASTNIPVSGIKTTDALLSVVEVDIAGDAVTDRTGEAAITSDGNIQLDTTDTTGSHLIVTYLVTPAHRSVFTV